ncbi:hypothetical protein [Alicyclobacillus fodiniaquatilis]|uniref:Uncharacterized protein n=1 Tax=Alicyclobacillus fodiniaquatilis TaxID=1661150 RepID=A0ABW4JIL8_9BACL
MKYIIGYQFENGQIGRFQKEYDQWEFERLKKECLPGGYIFWKDDNEEWGKAQLYPVICTPSGRALDATLIIKKEMSPQASQVAIVLEPQIKTITDIPKNHVQTLPLFNL